MADLLRDHKRERDIPSSRFFFNEEPQSEHMWVRQDVF